MAQLAMGIAGAAIGFVATGGNPMGAQMGFAIGTAAGGALFPPKLPDGPKLNDRQVQSSAYGETIPRIYGSYVVAGNVIWSTDLKETAKEQGGKGSGPSYTTYSYSVSFAVSLCQGPIAGVRRIWADGKLIYDARSEETDDAISGISNTVQRIGFSAQGYKMYQGDELQEPDPTIISFEGNAPAYRGEAYFVFTDLQLEKFGNRIPQMKFEVVASGTFAYSGPVEIFNNISNSPLPVPGISGGLVHRDPETDRLFVESLHSSGSVKQDSHSVFDATTQTILHRFPWIEEDDDTRAERQGCFNPRRRRYYILRYKDSFVAAEDRIYVYDADGYGLITKFTSPRTSTRAKNQLQLVYNPRTDEVVSVGEGGFNQQFTTYDITGTVRYYPFAGTFGGFNTPGYCYIIGPYLILTELGSQWTKIEIYSAFFYTLIRSYDLEDFFIVPQNQSWFGSQINRTVPTLVHDTKRNRWFTISTFSVTDNALVHHYAIFDAEDATFESMGLVELPGIAVINSISYCELTDQFVVSGSSSAQVILSASDISVVRSTSGGNSAPMHESSLYPGVFYQVASGNSLQDGYEVNRYSIGDVVDPEIVPLKDVVTAECAQVGLSVTDIDITRLVGNVRGFMVTGQGSGRGVIESLMNAYQFDAVESAGKLKFVSRGNAQTTTIDFDDLGTHEPGQTVPTPLPFTRSDETALPQKITVKYSDSDIEFQQGAQDATRWTTAGLNQIIIEVPVVMRGGEAKALAESALYSLWVGRTMTKFTVPRKYANVEPTDIVTINNNSIRISRKTLKGNMIEFEGALESGAIYAQTPVAGLTNVVNEAMTVLTRTNLQFLDIPILRDIDDSSSYYIAANGFEPGWPGSVIYKATDGETFFELTSLITGSVIGAATNALGQYDENTFDEINAVNVTLANRGMELESNTELQVLNGGNAALLGNEIIQFRTATLNSDNSYTLTGLLRGRKGTRTSGHASGDRFILLNRSSLGRPSAVDAEINLLRDFKAVTIGSTIAAVGVTQFTNTAIALRPFAPVQVGAGRNNTGNVVINWIRQTRIGSEWRDYVDASIGETTESYEIDIVNTAVSPAVVVRTLTATTNTVTYTLAQQETDFGSPVPSSFTARIFQMSSTYGRGLPAEAVI